MRPLRLARRLLPVASFIFCYLPFISYLVYNEKSASGLLLPEALFMKLAGVVRRAYQRDLRSPP